jgi:DNA-binding response OmpR family regulator
MAESVILFIEDELDHFEAVRDHLEPDFRCARSQALHVETIAKEITNLKPVAVVVDLMLFSSSGSKGRRRSPLAIGCPARIARPRRSGTDSPAGGR